MFFATKITSPRLSMTPSPSAPAPSGFKKASWTKPPQNAPAPPEFLSSWTAAFSRNFAAATPKHACHSEAVLWPRNLSSITNVRESTPPNLKIRGSPSQQGIANVLCTSGTQTAFVGVGLQADVEV